MSKRIHKIIIFNFLLIIFFLFSIKLVNSEIYDQINIEGNERLSVETIVMFSGIKIGKDITKENLNEAIKKLYNTGYFKDISIKTSNGVINIEITENPIIQSIKINGIKNKELSKKILNITKQSEKYPYLKENIKNQENLLLNTVRKSGFYFAKIETKLLENNNNSLDIIYNFELGERAIIKKIIFKGDKKFRDTKLRNVIKSEEGKFWKVITSNKYLDERRIDLDEKLLREFYLNKGYFNVKIKSSYAKNINNKLFELSFNIEAGEKYYFDKISADLKSIFNDNTSRSIESIFSSLKGKKYSQKKLNKILEEINKLALQNEYVFLDTKYNFVVSDSNKINVEILFNDLEKFYVEQINIFGNFITEEKVIRNSLIIDEGDSFNKILFDKSLDKIKSKRIFKSVKSDIKSSPSDPQQKIIDITVQEKPTGEIFAGAGTGTSGASLTAGLTENNYLGKGIKLSTNIMIAEDELKGKFSVINPNFGNTDRSLNTTLESTNSDFMSTGGFKTSRTGFGIGTGFEQYSDLFFNFDISTYYEKLETSSNATAHKKKQEGDYFENLFTYKLLLNNLDQNFQPTEGHSLSFRQVLPIYSDDLSIDNTLNLSKYYSITDNLILSGKFYLRAVNSIDDNVRVSRRVYIPSSKLRGFETGKIGPKDGKEYVGGNIGSAINLNTTLPNVLSGYENVDLNLFFDAATLREVDYDSSLESSAIRSAAGISVNWFTVIGPLSFSYAIPITSEDTDETESFRFRIGTSF